MQRYFAKSFDESLELYDSDIYHIKKVMRMNISDSIEVVYDNKLYLCKIESYDPFNISIINEIEEDSELPTNITIAVSLVNEQKFDLIIQKLTELGVKRIIPLKTERSIIKIDKSKEDKKTTRWKSICKEASEQSHRLRIPNITNIMDIDDLKNEEADIKYVCAINKNNSLIKINKSISSIIIVIGPEGGLSDKEISKLNSFGYESISLGNRVLRVETAAIYVASIINYLCN